MSSKNVRLSGPTLLTGAAATQYTTPAGTVTVIQFIQCPNGTTNAVSVTISVGADATGTRQIDSLPIPAKNMLSMGVKWILNPGDTIQAFASSTGVIPLTLYGQELTAG